MASRKKLQKELKRLKERMNSLKVSQEVKVQNSLNLEDLRPNQTSTLSGVNWGIQEIIARLDNLVFGLQDIKRSVTVRGQTKERLCLTTGPMIGISKVETLTVKILNNSIRVHKVLVTVFNLVHSPKENVAERLVTILPQCSGLESFDIGTDALDLQEFEVVLEFLNGENHNLSILVAGRKSTGTNIEPEYIIRHQELLPLISQRFYTE